MSRASSTFYVIPLILSLPLLILPITHPLPFPLPLPLPHTPLPPSHADPIPTQQLYIIPVTYGGVGNQLYFLLESIHIADTLGHTLILPPPPPRNLPNRPPSSPLQLFDLQRLRNLVYVRENFPAKCRSTIHHVIHAHRGNMTRTNWSSRVLSLACYFARRSNKTSTKDCGQEALEHAKVHDLHLPQSHIPNLSLFNVLQTLSGCILLDGHSYNRAGEKAQEALHSYLHYIQPKPEVQDIAKRYLADLVVHLRYDEHECFRKRRHQSGRVCVRAKLSTHGSDVVHWVKPEKFVKEIVTHANQQNLQTVYLAFSPYVPDEMVSTLQDLFSMGMHLIKRVQAEQMIENLVEREIAINADLFIGDFGSTWSGTVYYKRRTLKRLTVWSCRLLNLCQDLGYYRFEGVLRNPQWFRNIGLL